MKNVVRLVRSLDLLHSVPVAPDLAKSGEEILFESFSKINLKKKKLEAS
jgi:hypothetical protein